MSKKHTYKVKVITLVEEEITVEAESMQDAYDKATDIVGDTEVVHMEVLKRDGVPFEEVMDE